MRILGPALGALLTWSACGHALAAALKSSTTKDGRIIVSISGEIAEGDTDAFKAAVKSANDSGKLVTSIRLNSMGGNLVEGVKLAEAIRFAKVAANVGQGATCASACFLVFAAGETKFANYTAKIGVHGASDQTVQSSAATVSMARVAKELGVPPSIIGRMVVTPPSEMVWLTPQDLQTMGTTMIGRPAQVAVQDSVSGSPSQVEPTTTPNVSSATKASAPPTWNEYVDNAVAISARQNNGKAMSIRSCQPEFKTCFNAVVYKDSSGVETIAKVIRDMNDKVIAREVCTFNASGDIRKCFNWDTLAAHRDMQAADGRWTKVADE
jgi:hypothetical protein